MLSGIYKNGLPRYINTVPFKPTMQMPEKPRYRSPTLNDVDYGNIQPYSLHSRGRYDAFISLRDLADDTSGDRISRFELIYESLSVLVHQMRPPAP